MKHLEIYYATGNKGKFEEASHFIKNHAPEITLKQFEVDVDEIQSLDARLITLDKIHKAWGILKKPILVDDAGIYFENYNNFPGTLSKYVFEGIGFEGIFKLVSEGDKAYFCLQLAYTDGQITECFEGKISGSITTQKHALHPSLPFAAIFKPEGASKTLAVMKGTPDIQHYNPRHIALKKFLAWYRNQS